MNSINADLTTFMQKMHEIVEKRFVPSNSNNATNWSRFLRRATVIPTNEQIKKIMECKNFDNLPNSEIYLMYIHLKSLVALRG